MSHRIKRQDVPKLVAELAASERRNIGKMMQILLLEALAARSVKPSADSAAAVAA